MKKEEYLVTIEGITPLLCRNSKITTDYHHPINKLKSRFIDRRTEQAIKITSILDWYSGLYLDKSHSFVIKKAVKDLTGEDIIFTGGLIRYYPGKNIKASLIEIGLNNRLGTEIKTHIFISDNCFFEHKGNIDPELLKTDSNFIDERSVYFQRKRIRRTRPIFNSWQISFKLINVSKKISSWYLEELLEKAGYCIGIGDYRPSKKGDYGRFKLKELQELS
jgi:hypothetical protein